MNSALAVLGALGSALCFATSSALQQRGAARAPRGTGLHLDLIRHLITRPIWLLGFLAAVGTLGLQALALASGQLVLVQPLLIVGLLFALPLSVLLERRRPSLLEWRWAAILVAGLAVFLFSAAPKSGPRLPGDGRLWELGVIVLTVAVAVALVAVTVGGRHRALLLGAATGITYGAAAALIKYSIAYAGQHGIDGLFASWTPYALVVVGGAGILLNQAAYQAGPLCGALPAIAIADPLIAVLFGVGAFGEHIDLDLLRVGGQVCGFLLISAAIVQLARLAAGRAADDPHCAHTVRLERRAVRGGAVEVELPAAA
jgi:drug/metabolite transporter (DMT)-like permease